MKRKSIFARLSALAAVASLMSALVAPIPAFAQENEKFLVEFSSALVVPRNDIELGRIDLGGSPLEEYLSLSEGDELRGTISPQATYGFSVFGRYRVANFFAVEGGYTTSLANGNLDLQLSKDRTINKVDIPANSDNAGAYGIHALSAGVRGEYRAGPTTFYARAGMGLWRIDYNVLFLNFSEEGADPYFGGGVEHGAFGVGWTYWGEADIFNLSYNHAF